MSNRSKHQIVFLLLVTLAVPLFLLFREPIKKIQIKIEEPKNIRKEFASILENMNFDEIIEYVENDSDLSYDYARKIRDGFLFIGNDKYQTMGGEKIYDSGTFSKIEYFDIELEYDLLVIYRNENVVLMIASIKD